jgi:hypothetical protein
MFELGLPNEGGTLGPKYRGINIFEESIIFYLRTLGPKYRGQTNHTKTRTQIYRRACYDHTVTQVLPVVHHNTHFHIML